jgi:hypothetical protein
MKERLKIYRKALWDYRIAKFIKKDHTNYGFCYYFCWRHDKAMYHTFDSAFPELYAQRPMNVNGVYWFRPGDIKSRIECLKKAIKLTKQFINN